MGDSGAGRCMRMGLDAASAPLLRGLSPPSSSPRVSGMSLRGRARFCPLCPPVEAAHSSCIEARTGDRSLLAMPTAEHSCDRSTCTLDARQARKKAAAGKAGRVKSAWAARWPKGATRRALYLRVRAAVGRQSRPRCAQGCS